MPEYNLTPSQRELLRELVQAEREERLSQPIVILPKSFSEPPHVEDNPSIAFKGRDEFEALVDADLLGRQLTQKGNAVYSLKQSAFDAVDNDFEIPEHLVASQIKIGAWVNHMSGGNVQAVAQAINSNISQNVNDPEALRAAIDELGVALIDAVKSELPANDVVRYIKEVEELKAELAAESPRPAALKRILGTLSFFGDVEGTIGLALRVWPLIQVGLELARRLT